MAKGFKLKFKIISFQLCCSKRHDSTIPSIHHLSPMNLRSHDIGYPKLPAPPPSTPEYQCIVSPKITAIAMFATTNSPEILHCESTFCKMGLKNRGQKTKTKTTTMASVSSRSATRSDFFAHKIRNYIEEEEEEEEDSESLLSFSTSFSEEFYHEESIQNRGKQSKTEEKVVSNRRQRQGRKVKICKEKVQKLKFLHDSETEEKKGEKKEGKVKRASSMAEGCAAPAAEEGMVMNESFAVVKRSSDPYEDFRRSMVEMIMEMEMREGEDLERLLHCFLALNSRCYHGVIVSVFMEIWQELFSETSSATDNAAALNI